MVLIASVETFRVIHSLSSGIKNLLVLIFGKNFLLVFLFEWETLLPDIGPLPVKSQKRAMLALLVR